MRLTFAPHGYQPSIGGAQAYGRGLAEAMARRGHRVQVVVPDVLDPEAFYELGHRPVGVAAETIGGVAVRRIPLLSHRYRWGRLYGLRRGLESSLRRYRAALTEALDGDAADVVFTLPHLFPNVTEVLALRGSAPWRVVYAPMLHEHDPYWSVERVAAAVRRADGVVALTAHERERLVAAYGAREGATAVVSPGVDLPALTASEARRDEVLVLGRRTPSKRIDLVEAAMRLVRRRHPGVSLVVAGPGSEGKPGDGVQVIDRPDDTTRADLLARARVLVSASQIESFGLNLLEAWAHATPVIAVDTPVNRSIVRHGSDGWLVPADAAALAAAIEAALDEPATARAMGEQGRGRVAAEFTWERSAAELDRMIAAL